MYYIIVNPNSKTGRGVRIWKIIEPILTDRNIEYRVVFSRRPGHVTNLVRDLCDRHLKNDENALLSIIVLGGDGTLNEALQGITDFARVRIGYIPTGSSNDMARDLKLSEDPAQILERILDCREPLRMDVGCLTYADPEDPSLEKKRYFAVSTGIGYDAAVCAEVQVSTLKKVFNRLGLGKLVYLAIALKQLIAIKTADAVMVLDDEKEVKFSGLLFAACMIHQYEGGGFKFCPDADYTDGVLDIITASGISKPKILMALPQALKGNHFKFKGVERHAARRVRITASRKGWIHTDGETPGECAEITVTCEKEALRLLL